MKGIDFIDYLRKECRLTEYQIGKVKELLNSFEKAEKREERVFFKVCPKCGKVHPDTIRAGKAGSGKQMHRCLECGRRFTVDHGAATCIPIRKAQNGTHS